MSLTIREVHVSAMKQTADFFQIGLSFSPAFSGVEANGLVKLDTGYSCHRSPCGISRMYCSSTASPLRGLKLYSDRKSLAMRVPGRCFGAHALHR